MKTSTLAYNSTTSSFMESLELPQDLYWDGKSEPISPPSIELFTNLLHDDNFANGITLINDEELEWKPGFELQPTLFAGDVFLVEVDNLKEEEQWNDSKLLSPSLLEYPIGAVIAHPTPLAKVQSPFDLSSYGATSFDSAELTQLTPPHSPPQNVTTSSGYSIVAIEPSTNFTEVLPAATPPSVATSPLPVVVPVSFPYNQWANDNATNNAIATPNDAHPLTVNADDIARELQIVDEIVKKRAEEILNWNNNGCESESSLSASSMDDDWQPSYSSLSSAGSSPMGHCLGIDEHHQEKPQQSEVLYQYGSSSPSSSGSDANESMPKKRTTRPYGRGVEDRKIRKKEQNKNAATRYRLKKKIEMEHVLSEEQQLKQRNDELKGILADRKREAKYLKTLIKEFYTKKDKK